MQNEHDAHIRRRIETIRQLSDEGRGGPQKVDEWLQAGSMAQSVLHDTVGSGHPSIATIRQALDRGNHGVCKAVARSVVALYDQGGLRSPRLAIAHEIEGSVLDIADSQVQHAERTTDPNLKQLQLAIAAFLAGAALEDALRRLCDARQIEYDAQRTTIAKLQTTLYQPSKQIEVLSGSENKQITAWGDTRNKADHGKFGEITYAEVLTMTIGVRAFIDRHLP